MRYLGAFLLVTLAIFGLAFWMLAGDSGATNPKGGELLVHCSAGVFPPLEAVAKKYEKEYGVRIQIQSGGAGSLLANLAVHPIGDLFMASDDAYLQQAANKGLLVEQMPVAVLTPVLAVPKGNPHKVKGLEDLARGDLKVGLGNVDQTVIGTVSAKMLRAAKLWERVNANVLDHGVFKPTVADLANDLKLGHVDVAVVFDATVRQYPTLDMIEIAAGRENPQHVAVGVLQCSEQPTQALHFARYLTARDRGLVRFKELGYSPIQGDRWMDRPEIELLSGSILKPAIEKTLDEFAQREGVGIAIKYNGCGILVAQLRAGDKADAFIACDAPFVDDVQSRFPQRIDLSRTRLAILAQKGNPHRLKDLKDLAKPGLKVGVSQHQQSALGALTDRVLKSQGCFDEVMKNVVTQAPTGDVLVAQARTGALDAVVVFEVNARKVLDHCDVVAVQDPKASAIQPIAKSAETEYPQLVSRLMKTLRGRSSRDRFEDAGFVWLDSSGNPQGPQHP